MSLEPKVLIPVPKRTREESEFFPVPLPTEVPKLPSLHELPPHILHSGTVETLLGQNEDLMARLKVNIRRNSLLEQKINQLENELHRIEKQADAFETDHMVLEEKRKQHQQQIVEFELQTREMREEIQKSQIRYAELHKKYSRARIIEENFEEFQARQENHRKRLTHRIRRAGRFLRSQISELTDSKKQLEKEVQSLVQASEESRQLVSQLTARLQSRDIQSRDDLRQLSEDYEEALQNLKEKNQLLVEKLGQLNSERESLLFQMRDKDLLENRLVELERELSQQSDKSLKREAELKDYLEKYKRDAKRLLIENQSLVQRLRKSEQDTGALIQQKAHLEEDHESLQIIFAAKSRECEAFEKKIEQMRVVQKELTEQLKERPA